MAYANLNDVQTRLGRPITDAAEVDQVNAWISDVEATIQSRIEDLPERVVSDSVYAALVKKIVAQIVGRKVKNPDGKQNERIDDYSYGLGSEAARADLKPTEDEWEELAPGTSAGSEAFTIRMPLTPGVSERWVR
ncbi:Gp19/Gp15/Gp42 family protein [Brevibacterium linens]|uniref:Gp19/Gp15/Gp42 family protein n=1 Tax=Brevibacterium linens TaxID=1703 RepID=UPI003BF5E453